MQLTHDRTRNALRLTLGDQTGELPTRQSIPGVIDVAAGGRLVGLELQPGVEAATLARWFRPWLEDPEAGQYLDLASDGTVYVELTSGADDDQARSTPVEVELEYGSAGDVAAISIPRVGAGYEISYPSGNR